MVGVGGSRVAGGVTGGVAGGVLVGETGGVVGGVGGSGADAGRVVEGSDAGMMDWVRVVVMIPGVRVVVMAALETGSAAAVKIASFFNAATGTAGDVAGWTSPAREEAKAAATAAAVDTVGECVNE